MTDTEPRTSSVLVPYIAVDGAAAALDWYRDVFGAIETTRFVGDDGRVGHAEIVIGWRALDARRRVPRDRRARPAVAGRHSGHAVP